MVFGYRSWLAAVVLGLSGGVALAQKENLPAPAPVPAPAPEKVPEGNAAEVNGKAILEKAVFRSLRRLPPDKRAAARVEILNYLIDNVVLDQEVVRQGVQVEKKDVEARIEQIRAEIKKDGKDFDKVMAELLLTEAELRAQIEADLRWDRYASKMATDKILRELFATNLAMFNGSMVHARHILLTPPPNDPKAAAQAREKLAQIRKQIEDQVAQGMAKLDPKADNLKREEARTKLLDKAFADLASKESQCPSKAQGGNLPWFPRAGKMVEPFAKAAFDLKPYQLSDIVTTAFGYHLILVLEVKPGRPVKFEDARDIVKDYYCDHLRDEMVAKLRPAAKVVINPAPKP
jgi:parvulin-like peptidyl-prolyl isomerase